MDMHPWPAITQSHIGLIHMAGRRQHYLPRFLQRPFAFRQSGKHFYVYAHHRAHGAYATNVTELGQELDFYGGPEDTSLDDAITIAEKRLALTINRLNSGDPVAKEDIAALFSALSIRTKTMRKSLTDLLPVLLEAGRARLLDDNVIRKQLRKSLHDPKERKKLFYEQLRKNMPHQSREQRARLYAKALPQWKAFVATQEESFVAQMKELIRLFLDRAREEASSIADDAYLKALAAGPDKRTQRFADEMLFDIWDSVPGAFFILGDCGPVAMFTDGEPRLALGAIDDAVVMSQVFLPISPTRCIVGRLPSMECTLDVPGVNQISAALSNEFVISHEKESEALAALRQSIGSKDAFMSEDEVFQMLSSDQDT